MTFLSQMILKLKRQKANNSFTSNTNSMKNLHIPSQILALLFSLILFKTGTAQNVGINSSAASPDASAMLDIVSTSKGLLIPRVSLTSLTDASTIVTPATSLLVYNTNAAITSGVGYYYNSGTGGSPTWTKLVTTSSSGSTTIGGATDHTKFEADGTMVSEGAATVWDDVMVFPDGTTKGGSYMPTWTSFRKDITNNSQGTMLWMFSPSVEQEVYFTLQVPHGYKVGSDIFPHVHWTTTDANSPTGTNVVWGLEYTVASLNNAFPITGAQLTGSAIVGGITPSGTHQHLITPLTTMSGSGVGISTIFVCRLFRKVSDALDTYGYSVGLLGVDFHIEKDTNGSRSDFTK